MKTELEKEIVEIRLIGLDNSKAKLRIGEPEISENQIWLPLELTDGESLRHFSTSLDINNLRSLLAQIN